MWTCSPTCEPAPVSVTARPARSRPCRSRSSGGPHLPSRRREHDWRWRRSSTRLIRPASIPAWLRHVPSLSVPHARIGCAGDRNAEARGQFVSPFTTTNVTRLPIPVVPQAASPCRTTNLRAAVDKVNAANGMTYPPEQPGVHCYDPPPADGESRPLSGMKTYTAKPGEIQRQWFLVDAEGKALGRLRPASKTVLRGKNKPTFHAARRHGRLGHRRQREEGSC